VFCISQNLQMYEVPERASDGKASGRCSGSPKGFRYIVLALGEEADLEALNFVSALNLIRSTKLHLSTEPAFLPNACYTVVLLSFVSLVNSSIQFFKSFSHSGFIVLSSLIVLKFCLSKGRNSLS
jgi:hypothetical protein